MGNSRKFRRNVATLDNRPGETLVQAHNYPGRGSYNGYHCEECGVTTLVKHVDEGVTPMFLTCRAASDCTGRSTSLGYPGGPVPSELLPVKWEWYRPSTEEFLTLDREMQTHVSNGGLVLRPAS